MHTVMARFVSQSGKRRTVLPRHRSVSDECQQRPASKSVSEECLHRVRCRSIQMCPKSGRVSFKIFQDCPTKSAPLLQN